MSGISYRQRRGGMSIEEDGGGEILGGRGGREGGEGGERYLASALSWLFLSF